jgi:SAM-dependent methyltransferase
MDADQKATRAASFGSIASQYAEYRPTYPDDGVAWMVGSSPGRVLELGAGTGKLTQSLIALGHDVVATDPSVGMLAELHHRMPLAHTMVGAAESIALPSGSVDVVAAAQAFHWFDLDRALPEIARVLRPGGTLAIVWNIGDLKVPWVRKVFGLIGLSESDDVGKDPVRDSDLFAPSEQQIVRHWQKLDREGLLGFCRSNSMVATRPESEQRALLEEVGKIYDSYGRGPDGMLLPWTTYCYRSRVSGLPRTDGPVARHDPSEPIDEDDLDDGLLVDFR